MLSMMAALKCMLLWEGEESVEQRWAVVAAVAIVVALAVVAFVVVVVTVVADRFTHEEDVVGMDYDVTWCCAWLLAIY